MRIDRVENDEYWTAESLRDLWGGGGRLFTASRGRRRLVGFTVGAVLITGWSLGLFIVETQFWVK